MLIRVGFVLVSDWLAGLAGWLVGWLALVGFVLIRVGFWLVGWLGWLVGRLVGSGGFRVDSCWIRVGFWLVGWSAGWLWWGSC